MHHIVVATCLGEVPDEDHGTQWECYEDIMPNHLCVFVVFVWAVGGQVSLS